MEEETNTSAETKTHPEESKVQTENPPAQEKSDMVELVARLQKQNEEATTQLNELRERYLRSVAEFDNYRKRSLRDRDDARTSAVTNFLSDLLPAFDTFSRAIEAARAHHPEAKAVIDGIALIQTQINGVMAQNGVKEINPAVGDDFDPNLHESVAHNPSETVAEGKVSVVVRTGFMYNDRLVRAATVVVSSGPSPKE